MPQETITKENRAVAIFKNTPFDQKDGGTIWANLYVNARNGLQDADITGISWKGKTIAAARKWAEKQLNA